MPTGMNICFAGCRCVAAVIWAMVVVVALLASAPARAQILFASNQPYCDPQGCYDSRGLWVMNDDGSGAHPWLSELQVPQGTAGLSNPSVSPDGNTITFNGSSGGGAIWGIGIYKWQAGVVTRLSPASSDNPDTSTGSVATLSAVGPEIGPDG